MDKKANSKQMKAIIQRLLQYGEFEVVIFGDDTILNKPVDKWPVVQCLLSWHSGKFPLHKAQEYVLLRKPYLINDVFAQDILLDRRRVYRKLMVRDDELMWCIICTQIPANACVRCVLLVFIFLFLLEM